jgi:hypothetical protein
MFASIAIDMTGAIKGFIYVNGHNLPCLGGTDS